MRILIDGMPLGAGGGVQVAIALLQNLKHAQADFVGVFPHTLQALLPDEGSPGPESGQIRFLPKRGRVDMLLAARRLRHIEREVRPDVCFTVFGPAYFKARSPHLVGFALPNMVYPREGVLKTGLKGKLMDRVRRALLARADHLVVETETVRRRLIDRLGFSAEKITVIGNSVNPILKAYAPTALPDLTPSRVLVPSAYYPHKNLEIVPAVAAALGRMGHDAIFQLTLPSASPEWAAIARRSAELGVETRVTTLGNLSLDALAEAYRSARAVFLPTLREVSTAVYPEAFHFHRPVVTSDLDFARELCGQAALFVPALDPDRIALGLAEVLENGSLADDLVQRGVEQLARQYPTPEQKFGEQMALLASLQRGAR